MILSNPPALLFFVSFGCFTVNFLPMSSRKQKPVVYVIARPNGAGKTTFAMDYLLNEVHCEEFVNADMIARGLSPFNEESVAVPAGRLFLERIHRLAEQKKDFQSFCGL